MKKTNFPNLLPFSKGGFAGLGIGLTTGLVRMFPVPGIALLSFTVYISILFLICLYPKEIRFLRKQNREFCFWFLFGCLFTSAILIYRPIPHSFIFAKPAKQGFALEFQKQIRSILKRSSFSKEEILVAEGLVLGTSKSLPSSLKEKAKKGGVLHLFAASGLHLGIFLGVFLFTFKKLFWFSRILPLILSLLLGFVYLYCLDFPVSFIRAYSFAFYSFIGTIFYRKAHPSDILSYSSATVALVLPGDFLSVGFLLSFGAVFGIFYIKPILDSLFLTKSKHFLKNNLTLSIACSLASFPFLVHYFHSYSFGSILVNLFLVPFAGIVLPSLYLSLGLEFLSLPYISPMTWLFSEVLMKIFMRSVLESGDRLGFWIFWEKTPRSILIYFCLICFTLIVLYFQDKNPFLFGKREDDSKTSAFRKRGFIFLSILCFFPFGIWISRTEKNFETIDFVRKGSAFFLRGKSVFLLGNCYSASSFDTFRKKIFSVKIDEIYFEKESCLRYVLELSKEFRKEEKEELHSRKRIQTVDPKLAEWLRADPTLGKSIAIEKKKLFSVFPFPLEDGSSSPAVLRFTGDKKSYSDLFSLISFYESLWKRMDPPSASPDKRNSHFGFSQME